MFFNLIWLFIVLQNRKKEFLKKILLVSIYSLITVSVIWIRQYYAPSFNYLELWNRAISTLGHPNYLALYILMLTPLIFQEKYISSNKSKYLILTILIFTLIITKSILWIVLLITYLVYKTKKYFSKKTIIYSTLTISLILIILLINLDLKNIVLTKTHSFISRFFIWETTLNIVTSNIKVFTIWNGAETLKLVFDNYKSSYLYIFENIWFTADRPHNLVLNFFYHFWFLWLLFVLTIIYGTIKIALNKNKCYIEILALFFLFTVFNFPSIIHYLLFITTTAIITKNNKKYKIQRKAWGFIFFIIIFIISSIWVVYSAKFYIAENLSYKGNIEKAISLFPYNSKYYYDNLDYNNLLKIEKFKSEKYYKANLYSANDILKNCKELTKKFPSVENYFFCWKLLERFSYKKESINYYKSWLKKIPDLWNKNSKYWDNNIIKKTISWNRFFSEKYSDIKNIIEKIEN